jgi:hypothetical protein
MNTIVNIIGKRVDINGININKFPFSNDDVDVIQETSDSLLIQG